MTSTPAPSRQDLIAALESQPYYDRLNARGSAVSNPVFAVIEDMAQAMAEAADEILSLRAALASEPEPQPVAEWQDIASAPKDRIIWVYAPGLQELEPIICLCEWHEDGGFCVDELRYPTLWCPVAAPASPHLSAEPKP